MEDSLFMNRSCRTMKEGHARCCYPVRALAREEDGITLVRLVQVSLCLAKEFTVVIYGKGGSN